MLVRNGSLKERHYVQSITNPIICPVKSHCIYESQKLYLCYLNSLSIWCLRAQPDFPGALDHSITLFGDSCERLS